MTKTEKLIPLTTQDIEKLKARKGGGRGCFLIVVIATVIISVFLYFLVSDIFGGSFFSYNGILIRDGILVVPFSLAFIALAYFIQRGYSGTASKDVQEGKKKVVTAQVLSQFTEDLDPSRSTSFANTTAYIIDIDGVHYDVKEADYRKFNVGMWVEVHTAPHSGEFLGIYEPGTGRLLADELL